MLSQAWGVQPTRDGKVVWAELDLTGERPPAATGERPPAATPPQEQPRVPADGVAAASPGLRTIHFVGVPVEAYLALQEHNDALFRELELISIELATPGAVARPTSSRLASLVDQLYGQFRNQRDGHGRRRGAGPWRADRRAEGQGPTGERRTGARLRRAPGGGGRAVPQGRAAHPSTPCPGPLAATLVRRADGRPAPRRRGPGPAG
jgi:hypothetical protein